MEKRFVAMALLGLMLGTGLLMAVHFVLAEENCGNCEGENCEPDPPGPPCWWKCRDYDGCMNCCGSDGHCQGKCDDCC